MSTHERALHAPPARTTSPTAELFGAGRGATTVGMLLLISMVAFEALGVSTAMPAVIADFGAISLYAWPTVTFMAANVFGIVVGGQWCDSHGPRVPLLVAPVLFAAGLLTAGTAAGMPQLLAGRVLQGVGAGIVTVSLYVLVARVYPERVRPPMFGLMSSAWVLPSLVGPPVSGFVTERLSWRWVFIGLVPVAVLALALVVPVVRRLGPPDPDRDRPATRRWAAPAALAAAVGVSALSWAGQHPGWVAAVVAVVALALLVPALRVLLPAGVFRARRGIPVAVAAQGLCAALFFTANTYLPLMLTGSHHWSLAAAGLPLVFGSLGWSSASWWQGRHPDLPRPRLLRVGFVLLTVGVLGLVLVAPGWGVAWPALPLWVVAGLGMGTCFPSTNLLLLRQSAVAQVGFHTSAAQISSQLATAVMVGVGGALLATLGAPGVALPVLVVMLAGLGVLGALIAPRALVVSA